MRNTFILITILSITPLMSGCSGIIKINEPVAYNSNLIKTIDNRTEESKQEKRESVFSAVAFIAENKIQPKPLDLFISEYVKINNPNMKIVMEIDDFLIMDYFPERLSSLGLENGLIGAMFATPVRNEDQYYINRLETSNVGNSIICIYSGKIDSSEIKSAYREPYKVSLSTVMIRNDPDFHRAVSTCIIKLAEETTDRLRDKNKLTRQ